MPGPLAAPSSIVVQGVSSGSKPVFLNTYGIQGMVQQMKRTSE